MDHLPLIVIIITCILYRLYILPFDFSSKIIMLRIIFHFSQVQCVFTHKFTHLWSSVSEACVCVWVCVIMLLWMSFSGKSTILISLDFHDKSIDFKSGLFCMMSTLFLLCLTAWGIVNNFLVKDFCFKMTNNVRLVVEW